MTNRSLVAAGWVGIVLLAALGLFTAGARALHVHDLGNLIVPFRQGVLAAAGLTDTLNSDASLHSIDESFSRYPAMTLLHVIPGGLLMLLAPLQLVRRIRSRWPAVHRWSGRLIVAAGIPTALTALFFGILHPLSGTPEAILIALVGALFLFAIGRAWIAIRRRDTATHREWMLRAFAVMFAVPLTRVLGTPIDLALVNVVTIQSAFAIDLWASWLLMIGGAEWWIRRTRPRRHVAAVAGAGAGASVA